MSAEFALKLSVTKLSSHAQPVRVEANEAARAALAARFGLAALDRLEADLEVARAGQVAVVTGRFVADVVQSCIVSGEPLPAHVEDEIALRFEPHSATPGQDLELEADALDVMPLDGDSVDLAEAVAQSLLLALDPYPRASDEVLARVRRHLMTEEEAAAAEAQAKSDANPFSKLRKQ